MLAVIYPKWKSDSFDERSLAGWLYKQRRDQLAGKLSSKKQKLLESLPDFKWNANNEQLAIEQFSKVIDWIDTHKRLPRKRSDDLVERKFSFALTHRREAKKGLSQLVHYESIDSLCIKRGYPDLLLERDRKQIAIDKLNEILDWCDANGRRMPSLARGGLEKTYAGWLASKRQAKVGKKWKNGSLTFYEELDELCKKRGYAGLFELRENKHGSIS